MFSVNSCFIFELWCGAFYLPIMVLFERIIEMLMCFLFKLYSFEMNKVNEQEHELLLKMKENGRGHCQMALMCSLSLPLSFIKL